MIIASGFREQENPNFRYLFAFEKHASQSRRKSAQLVDNTHDVAHREGTLLHCGAQSRAQPARGETEAKGKTRKTKDLAFGHKFAPLAR